MPKVFISYRLADREQFAPFHLALKSSLKLEGIEVKAFIFDDHRESGVKAMMRRALKMIDQCDLLVAEISRKAIGIGVEAGYAKGKGKKVIYIRKRGSPLSTTVDGIADATFEYDSVNELLPILTARLHRLLSK